MMENEEVMGGTSEPVDKVNLVDEDEDDDDLVEVELEDVPVTVRDSKEERQNEGRLQLFGLSLRCFQLRVMMISPIANAKSAEMKI
uniref:Uncharacterized protein n=1 Tax=Fagus sylvatica TaxID=28930 RepID=A0A2N9HF53_FAGSY